MIARDQHEASINIANQVCSNLKSRVAAPITILDFKAIYSWAFTPVTPTRNPDFMIGPLETNKTISWAIYPDR